ncbi:MAG TPA: hypothetical protein VHW47_04295 [Acidimicrobiales bacterium]|nr:hypothetical protein [Acidimicrobiales bacterium]
MLRRLLLLAALIGVAALVRQRLLAHNGPGAVGSPDHWPPVPRKPPAPTTEEGVPAAGEGSATG